MDQTRHVVEHLQCRRRKKGREESGRHWKEDHGGPALKLEAEHRGGIVIADAVVPDDRDRIRDAILSFEAQGCSLILTTGGTGITERDVTPEAVRDIMRVEIDGLSHQIALPWARPSFSAIKQSYR